MAAFEKIKYPKWSTLIIKQIKIKPNKNYNTYIFTTLLQIHKCVYIHVVLLFKLSVYLSMLASVYARTYWLRCT